MPASGRSSVLELKLRNEFQKNVPPYKKTYSKTLK